jgi:hypothetical protein
MTIHKLTKCDHDDPNQSCTICMTIVYPEECISEFTRKEILWKMGSISREREKFSVQGLFITFGLGSGLAGVSHAFVYAIVHYGKLLTHYFQIGFNLGRTRPRVRA